MLGALQKSACTSLEVVKCPSLPDTRPAPPAVISPLINILAFKLPQNNFLTLVAIQRRDHCLLLWRRALALWRSFMWEGVLVLTAKQPDSSPIGERKLRCHSWIFMLNNRDLILNEKAEVGFLRCFPEVLRRANGGVAGSAFGKCSKYANHCGLWQSLC